MAIHVHAGLRHPSSPSAASSDDSPDAAYEQRPDSICWLLSKPAAFVHLPDTYTVSLGSAAAALSYCRQCGLDQLPQSMVRQQVLGRQRPPCDWRGVVGLQPL